MNLYGSIDLLKLEKAGVATIHGKRCVVIPADENDIFIKADETTLKATGAFLGISVNERQTPSEYGKTHYCKQSLSKQYREQHPQETEDKKRVYLGDFKPFEITQPVATAPAISLDDAEADGLPF